MHDVLTSASPTLEVSGSKAVFREGGRTIFAINAPTEKQLNAFLRNDTYSAATGFVRGDFDVDGDLVRAIEWRITRPGSPARDWLLALTAKLARNRFSMASGAAHNIQFHYDRSNRFYETFLDSRMVYSCGYFKSPADSIEEAQIAKLEHVCRKLRVEPGDRFLDIGCGWGALLFHAAERWGAICSGCTLSRSQIGFIRQKLEACGDVRNRITAVEADFQEARGVFDKIASIGMFEHVGHRRLRSYFRHIAGLLSEQGLFLNHAIARPQTANDGPETLFLQKYVFPGGDLLHLSEVVTAAEEAGFETLDVENLRPHYALTCRAWVSRLQRAAAECAQIVPKQTYRTWLLYLAACAVSFESAGTDIYQVLFAKRSASQRRPLTRDYIYR